MKIVNVECFGTRYENRYFIENLEDLKEYHETIFSNRISKSMKQTVHDIRNKHHFTDELSESILLFSGERTTGILRGIANMAGNVFSSQAIDLSKGKKLVINDNLGYFTLPDNSVVEFVKKRRYTEKDIHIHKFEGGKHWYATICAIDVIDEWGDRKWNTYEFAERVSKSFLNKLNEN